MEKTLKVRKNNVVKKTPGELVLYSIVFIIFLFFAFTYVYVLFWCAYSGMRNVDDFVNNSFGFSKIQFSNYGAVFSLFKVGKDTFFTMFLNSMYFSFFGPFLCMFVTSMLAYVTSKYKFFGAGSIYFIVLVVITLPIYGSSSAQYRLIYNLGLINTPGMILTSLNGFSIYYMYFYAFYKSMSWSYAEAAEIDGANDFQIYFKVMFPQAITMFGSLFLMLWMADWNNYGTALIYLSKMPTLAVGIYKFKQDMVYFGGGRPDILYAACTLVLIPPLVMFTLCNKALMSNVSLGGIKE